MVCILRLLTGLLCASLLLCQVACVAPLAPGAQTAEQAEHYRMRDFARVVKVDAHVHANSRDTAFIQQAKADNMFLLSINVDYPDFPPIDEQYAIAQELATQAPAHFAFAATFSMLGWQQPDWQQNVYSHLQDAFAKGAVGVKVWKNIGMAFRDRQDQLVMIDDAGFDGVFDYVHRAGKVLIGHQGEPKNCWLPVEQMTVNNDKLYFAAHPEYHMYLQPHMPGYQAQMQARDRMLAKHPGLSFMGAHLASLEWSVDEIAVFLQRFPNAVVDTAARMGQLQFQSQRDHQKVRDFFIRYQDRILYASDLTHSPGRDGAAFRSEVQQKWLNDWRYLNTAETMQVPEVDGDVQGLALPKKVADKIFRTNAQRVFALHR